MTFFDQLSVQFAKSHDWDDLCIDFEWNNHPYVFYARRISKNQLYLWFIHAVELLLHNGGQLQTSHVEPPKRNLANFWTTFRWWSHSNKISITFRCDDNPKLEHYFQNKVHCTRLPNNEYYL